MSITLSDGTGTIELHKDLLWSDENDWHPVEQTVQRTVTGALIVQSGTRVAGRPITLEPEDDHSAAMTADVIEALRNWAAVPGKVMALTLRGTTRDVIFRQQDGGLAATPWIHYDDVVSSDYYLAVVRLMEI
jgi:hypothetical protein